MSTVYDADEIVRALKDRPNEEILAAFHNYVWNPCKLSIADRIDEIRWNASLARDAEREAAKPSKTEAA